MDRHRSGAPDDTLAADPGTAGGGATLIGQTLGNYKVIRLLGQGGMGSVFLGEHQLIGRQVAIKVLDPQVAGHPEVVSRFFVEARAVNEIRHPNIVEVTDLGTMAGQPYIVMEYLPGETLEARLARAGRLSPEETVRIARQVASALGAAHDRGMVHRDLKPANIMLREHPDYPDFVKVLDFGIAKLLSTAQTPAGHRTEVGTLMGTPAFMSPEQCLGDVKLDHRSDIYSLGVILFMMLGGRLPFDDEATGRLIVAHVSQPPPLLAAIAPEVPPALAAVVDRALAKKPDERFASMKELRAALEQAVGATAPRSLTPVGGVPVQAPAPAGPAARPTPTPIPSRTPTPAPVSRPPQTAVLSTAESLAPRIAEAVADRLSRGQLQLPALPPAYARCLQVLRDPGFSYGTLAAALKQDSRLASHVVRRSNGDGAAGRGTATTPEQAIPRLGHSGLRAAVVELAARRVIEARADRMEDELRRPGHHALAGAVVAERLIRLRGLEHEAGDAVLAALLRDLGVPLVGALVFELEFELGGHRAVRSLPPATWLPIVRRHQRAAGVLLVRHWGLSEELAKAIADGGGLQPPGSAQSNQSMITNFAVVAGALADREGFYLHREWLMESEALADTGPRAIGLNELQVRRAVDRLKEAVRLRE